MDIKQLLAKKDFKDILINNILDESRYNHSNECIDLFHIINIVENIDEIIKILGDEEMISNIFNDRMIKQIEKVLIQYYKREKTSFYYYVDFDGIKLHNDVINNIDDAVALIIYKIYLAFINIKKEDCEKEYLLDKYRKNILINDSDINPENVDKIITFINNNELMNKILCEQHIWLIRQRLGLDNDYIHNYKEINILNLETNNYKFGKETAEALFYIFKLNINNIEKYILNEYKTNDDIQIEDKCTLLENENNEIQTRINDKKLLIEKYNKLLEKNERLKIEEKTVEKEYNDLINKLKLIKKI